MTRLASYVAGKWIEGTGPFTALVNPADEQVLAEASSAGVNFHEACRHARSVGSPALRSLSFGQRAALLKATSKLFHTHREALLDIAQQNGGNTRGDAKFDVDGAIGTLAAYAAEGEALAAKLGDRTFLLDGEFIQPTRSPRFVGQHVWTTRPGIAVHINAFNFPAWGTFEKLAVAWLAGVAVITKPATATALLTERMIRLLVDAGLAPEGAVQLVCGGTGDLLSVLSPMDALAFTGSNATGAFLRNTAGFAEKSIRVNVEADSLNAAVIGPDVAARSALFDTAVRHVFTDMTQKTGQKCTAIRRVLVPEALMDDFVEALEEQLRTVVVGDPLAEGVTMGPVSTASQLRDVLSGIGRLAEGGTIVTGGPSRVEGRGAPAGKGFFVAPTLIRREHAGIGPVHELEVFGPCVSVLPYEGDADVAVEVIELGHGSLVTTAYSDDRQWTTDFALQGAAHLGRLMLVGTKVADQVTAPGMVLPGFVHGGPGRAGGGEELGGLRGLELYMQRTALQGDRGAIAKMLGIEQATS